MKQSQRPTPIHDAKGNPTPMSRAERDDLQRLARLRERTAKSGARRRTARPGIFVDQVEEVYEQLGILRRALDQIHSLVHDLLVAAGDDADALLLFEPLHRENWDYDIERDEP
jgi:hypothetical protein